MSLKIQFNHGLSLVNPVLKGTTVRYDGPIGNFDRFDAQQANYDRLRESLATLNITLDHVWAGYFERSPSELVRNFLVSDRAQTIVWRKYEALGKGTGQNWLYLYGTQTKLTAWLTATDEERAKMLRVALAMSRSTKFQ